jgi:NitT/TauT family transport system substrate-binding protein
MKRTVAMLATCFVVGTLCPPALSQISKVRVGFCARTISSGAAPYAVATKMGWFKEEGIAVELVPLSSSADCVKNIANKEIPFALADVVALSVGRIQGLKAKIFYTAYQGNIFGMAVPRDSPIQKIADLKGKTIGLLVMGGPGLWFAKAQLTRAGLDPEQDVKFVVAGEGAQTAAMLRSRQVDALSQFDTQYAMIENAGLQLRPLGTEEIERFPGNGFLALEETLRTDRKDASALARGYAKGTIFTISNPEAAVRIFDEVFPAARPLGKDEATAIRDDTKILQARIPKWRLDAGGVKRWGESSEANYAKYLDFLLKWGGIKEKVGTQEVITNELIDEINRFDSNKIVAEARTYKLK